ncbi:hypothetical protein L1987_03226 [Smallanthus sonchifolius]|uniref:Uncharacterized protein n=1 Tax=Smallanthus sonchifolius TaxID=185202 RepID=A0ACB9K9X6_9ASTR|nr:hypothetical protein L1987_03226 [Smallanthus sonchifolius]
MGPNQLDLDAISDLFSVSRPIIAKPSNLTSLTLPLFPNQALFIPLTCTCNSVNTTTNLSYAKLNYTIKKDDTFYLVPTNLFHNLTTYQSVEIVNPTLVPINLTIGQDVTFPIFCKCPTKTQLQNQVNYLISCVFQPFDTISSIASRFGSTTTSVVEVNGAFALGTLFSCLFRVFLNSHSLLRLAFHLTRRVTEEGRESLWKKKTGKDKIVAESKKFEVEVSLMADVSDCLDKYKVYKFEELNEATDGFDERWDSDNANCYLVYEYLENGSLYTKLHDSKTRRLSWRRRLRIAIDIDNGLQYIHEHTISRVVHKDIKSSNILLDAHMRAKIANFGLAKSGCNAITRHIVGTQGYVAPEYIYDGIVSTKIDVFSFGVILLELVSGREVVNEEGKALWVEVYENFNGKDEKLKYKLEGFIDDDVLREPCSIDSVMNVMSIAIASLHRDPSRRPSMVDIVYALCKSDDLFTDLSEDGFSSLQVLTR